MPVTIPDRLTVGQRPLEPLIVVRIHVGEPLIFCIARLLRQAQLPVGIAGIRGERQSVPRDLAGGFGLHNGTELRAHR